MASLSPLLLASNTGVISAVAGLSSSRSNGSRLASLPVPSLPSSRSISHRLITTSTNLHRTAPYRLQFSRPSSASTPALRSPSLSRGKRSGLLVVAAAANREAGETGESGSSDGVGEMGDVEKPKEEVEMEKSVEMGSVEDQRSADEPVAAEGSPDQRLTAHLDLGQLKQQLQRSNERTKENLRHLHARLQASNDWTLRHLRAAPEENLKHLHARLQASNDWTLRHLKVANQWTSTRLKESNQRTAEHLQQLMHSDLDLEHLDLGHLDVLNLKGRLQVSNARTREQLQHLEERLEHLDFLHLKPRLQASNAKTMEHLRRSNARSKENLKHLHTRLQASNAKTKEHLKRSSRHASHTAHGVADVLSVIGAAAAAATSGSAPPASSSAPAAPSTRVDGQFGRATPAAAAAAAAAATSKPTSKPPSSRASSNTSSRAPPAKRGPRQNPYLSGNFRPVASEVLSELDCAVLGAIPPGLEGRFLRNGPNPQLPPSDPALYHWFDGDGMAHSLTFHPPEKNQQPSEDNISPHAVAPPRVGYSSSETSSHSPRVSYSRRYIRTTGWEEERAAGRALFGGLQQVGLGASHLLLAALNLLGLRQQDAPMWNMTKNVSNNHFIFHAGRLLSLWEAGLPYSLDAASLDTLGVHSFDDTWRSGMTAHPKVDPVTNHMMIYGYNLTHKPYLRYGVVDPSGALVHSTDIDLPHPIMMHDFAITEHYSIFLDFPLRFQLDKVIQSHGKAKPFVFDPSKPSRIGVLPRFGSNSDIQWFTVDPGFCLHVVNAFEEPSSSPSSPLPTVVVRVVRFSAFSALGLAELADDMACDEVARLHEYRLDLDTLTSEERSLGKVSCDFPSINPNFTGRPHRFAYTAKFAAQPGPGTTIPSFNAIMKHDFREGTRQVHTLPPGQVCGEPVFAPRHHFQSTRIQSSRGGGKGSEENEEREGGSEGSETREGSGAGEGLGMGAEEEDDGWVLAHVWDEEEARSEVIVLDAKNLDQELLARVILPKRVPHGFHGTFLPN